MTRYSIIAILPVIAMLLALGAFPVHALSVSDWSAKEKFSDKNLYLEGIYGNTMCFYSEEGMVFTTDNGKTWSDPFGEYCRVFWTDAVIYRVDNPWIEDEDGEHTVLQFSKSTDGGKTWSDPLIVRNMEDTADGDYDIYKFGSTLLIYSCDEGRDYKIYSYLSTDDGKTWNGPYTIDDSAYMIDQGTLGIVDCGGKLYKVFYDQVPGTEEDDEDQYQVVLKESSDTGKTWTDRRVIASDGWAPAMQVYASQMYVAYAREDGIYFTTSNNGDDWSAPVKVGPIARWGDDAIGAKSMAVHGSDVFITYTDAQWDSDELTGYVLRFYQSADGGKTFTDMKSALKTEIPGVFSDFILMGGSLMVIWEEFEGSWSSDGTGTYKITAQVTFSQSDEPKKDDDTASESSVSPVAIGIGVAAIIFVVIIVIVIIAVILMRKRSKGPKEEPMDKKDPPPPPWQNK